MKVYVIQCRMKNKGLRTCQLHAQLLESNGCDLVRLQTLFAKSAFQHPTNHHYPTQNPYKRRTSEKNLIWLIIMDYETVRAIKAMFKVRCCE